MARARRAPVDDDGSPKKGKTAEVKYVGPEGQVSRAFVSEVGEAPKPGKTYEVSADLAESLVRSSRHWKEA